MYESLVNYTFYKTTVEAWDGMYQALLQAKKSIFWEVYILLDDEVGKKFIELLILKATQGLEVKIVIDTVGSMALSKEMEQKLKRSQVDFLWYNRIYPEWRLDRWLTRLWIRNHRKILVIDENMAFVGGVNIDNSSKEWDDLVLCLKGEAVKPLLRGFAKTYIYAGGEKRDVRRFLHPYLLSDIEKIKEKVNFLLYSPHISVQHSSIKRLYIHQLAKAKKYFTLLTPYYSPDKKFFKQLYRAKKRNVTVDIMLPVKPDHKFLQYIAQSFYDVTQKTGARLFLLPRMNHGKALCVDNNFGFVGSVNFTPRSFSANEEAGVYFRDRTMVKDLQIILENWKSEASLVNTLGSSSRRWTQRFLSWVTSYFKDYV